jgi:hypothetical protein
VSIERDVFWFGKVYRWTDTSHGATAPVEHVEIYLDPKFKKPKKRRRR